MKKPKQKTSLTNSTTAKLNWNALLKTAIKPSVTLMNSSPTWTKYITLAQESIPSLCLRRLFFPPSSRRRMVLTRLPAHQRSSLPTTTHWVTRVPTCHYSTTQQVSHSSSAQVDTSDTLNCIPCSYSTSSQNDYITHLTSKQHNDILRAPPPAYHCATCAVSSTTTEHHIAHLTSELHNQSIRNTPASQTPEPRQPHTQPQPTTPYNILTLQCLHHACDKAGHTYTRQADFIKHMSTKHQIAIAKTPPATNSPAKRAPQLNRAPSAKPPTANMSANPLSMSSILQTDYLSSLTQVYPPPAPSQSFDAAKLTEPEYSVITYEDWQTYSLTGHVPQHVEQKKQRSQCGVCPQHPTKKRPYVITGVANFKAHSTNVIHTTAFNNYTTRTMCVDSTSPHLHQPNHPALPCICGKEAQVRTACTQANRNRRFYSCAAKTSRCNFFQWLDHPSDPKPQLVSQASPPKHSQLQHVLNRRVTQEAPHSTITSNLISTSSHTPAHSRTEQPARNPTQAPAQTPTSIITECRACAQSIWFSSQTSTEAALFHKLNQDLLSLSNQLELLLPEDSPISNLPFDISKFCIDAHRVTDFTTLTQPALALMADLTQAYKTIRPLVLSPEHSRLRTQTSNTNKRARVQGTSELPHDQ